MPGEKTRILLVEDNPGDADLTIERLHEAGVAEFEIRCVSTLRETMRALAAEPTDAVILDLDLPDSRGIETVSRVVAAAGTAPVVVVSGSIDENLHRVAQSAGAHDTYSKDEIQSRLFPRNLLHVVERHHARERQMQIEALLDTTPDAILVSNRDGVVRYVNEAALGLFCRRREDLIGEPLGFSVHDGESTEIRVDTAGGTKSCELRVVAFQWQGETAFVAVIRDVTQRKYLEAQLLMNDRLVSMGTLAAGVAHEINNPLAAVVANVTVAIEELSHLMLRRDVIDGVMDALRDTRDAAEQIRQIVRDLKVYSRAEPDETSSTAFEVHHMLDAVARLAWHEVRQRARLVKDYGGKLVVVGNESRMSQVFLNLVINAAQAIPAGAPEFHEIRIRTAREGDGRVVVEVRDTGAGIPLEVRPRLFTPFVTTKPIGSGTGLGLAICQRIVTAAGGRIDYTSQLGVGTSFFVRLQAVDDAAARAADVEGRGRDDGPPQAAALRPTRRGRVLAIDDEALVLTTLERALGRVHEVVCESRATNALARIEAGERFDVILCDIMMPEMTGIEFATALEISVPEQAQRIVFVTGGALQADAQNFLEQTEYIRIEKPFDLSMLRAVMQRFLAVGFGDQVASDA